jgi:hypothetical protein
MQMDRHNHIPPSPSAASSLPKLIRCLTVADRLNVIFSGRPALTFDYEIEKSNKLKDAQLQGQMQMITIHDWRLKSVHESARATSWGIATLLFTAVCDLFLGTRVRSMGTNTAKEMAPQHCDLI